MTTVALVGCSSKKLDRVARAQDMYLSDLFAKSRAYAERFADVWLVLSAKYGVVEPTQWIEPYDVRLGVSGGPPIHQWSENVISQLRALEVRHEVQDMRLLILAGEAYRTPFIETAIHRVPWPVEVPMRGLGIGEQLRFLKQALEVAS